MTQPSTPGQSVPARPNAAATTKTLFPVDSDTHLLDRLNAVYKYRYVVVTVFLLVIIGVIVRTYTTTPMYRATTTVLVEDERGASVAGFNNQTGADYSQDTEPYFQTQLRILAGRELAGKVVDRLHLDTVPEFNGQEPRTGLAVVLHTMKAQAQGVLGKVIGGGASAPEAPGKPSRDALVNRLLGSVNLEPVRGSRLVNVSITSSNPTFAARTADALVEEYVKQNFAMRSEATQKSLTFLDDEIAKQKTKVEESEREMADYREHNNALSLDDKQNTVSATLNQLNDQYTRTKTERIQKETLYKQVEGLSPSTPQLDTIPAITMNPQVQALRQRLVELNRTRAALNDRYGEKNPEVIANANQIEDTNKQYYAALTAALGTIKTEYETARRQESSLAAELNAQKGAAMDLNRKGVNYTVIEREAQSNRALYEALLARQKELQVVSNSGGNNVRLMDRAVVPGAPYTPDVKRNLMLGALAGILLALGLVMAIDYLDDTVKTPEDITRRLKLPFLGLVPAVKGQGHPLLSQEVPHEFGEAFRALRTSLVFSSGNEGTRVIGLTSAQPLEGKTTTACNMAIALAYGGSRVLLIDADMRRPSVSRTLGLENTVGLSHLLTGQAMARQAIQRTSVQNLWVMTAGMTPPNPSELLSSDRMKTLISNVQHGPFDWVLIDTPPVLAVTDAVIIAPWVSGMVFIIGSEMTQRRLAERAVETLQTSRPHILGAVLNRVDIIRNKYYYSRYYGYKYKNYYVRSNVA
ncbi:MAG TPA: polysaccharide biosynthesis tyrosine autokinase [Vicinamibacterales bacterium]|nr:polysaccharide biosynthesis tyrosine autokinase [Vicinamibacterales bacterium]